MKTMNRIKVLLSVAAVMLMMNGKAQNTACNVTLNFTTVTTNNGFAPKHVFAVWVEDNSGNFIRTVKLNADKRKQYLYTWNDETSGNTVDAVTGATKNSHSAETIVWDGKNTSKAVVPDGTYKLFVEFTEEHAQGPILIIPFTKSTTGFDSTLAAQTNFVNISIDYALSSATGIENTTQNSDEFSVYPNPITNDSKIKILADKNTHAHLYLYSVSGQIIADFGQNDLIAGENFISFNTLTNQLEISSGTYLLRLEYNNEIKIIKLVKP